MSLFIQVYNVLHTQILFAEMESLFSVKTECKQFLSIRREANCFLGNALSVSLEDVSSVLCLTPTEYQWVIKSLKTNMDIKHTIWAWDYVLTLQKEDGFAEITQTTPEKEVHVILSPADIFTLATAFDSYKKLLEIADIEKCTALVSQITTE